MNNISSTPRYADAVYYARFHHAGWHAVKRWGDYIDIRLECGRTISVWDDSAAEVVGKPPAGLCRKCASMITRQGEMEL